MIHQVRPVRRLPPEPSAAGGLAVLLGVAALLGHQLDGVAPVHAEALEGVTAFHPGELRCVLQLEQGVLGGVARAEHRLLGHAGLGRLRMLGHVAIGEGGVLLHVAVQERLVGRQMLPRHPGVVVDVAVFGVLVVGRMPPGGRCVLLGHGHHLVRSSNRW